MNSVLRIPLNATPEQGERLAELQREFAEVCNALVPLVRSTRTWNRVALHHMAYRDLRQRFPALGSQMVCNAIYSVSRTARVVFQAPGSPFHLSRLGGAALPRLSFGANAPVYFDRHTLSLKAGQLSMFTLDGRMRFQLDLAPQVEQRFRDDKLREIVLARSPVAAGTGTGTGTVADAWELRFRFGAGDDTAEADAADEAAGADLPEYVLVLQDDPEPPIDPVAAIAAPGSAAAASAPAGRAAGA